MRADLISELCNVLGDGAVHVDEHTREMHSADALNPVRAYHTSVEVWNVPDVVVTPSSTQEVAAIVKLASNYGVPVVPFGGGTGVMGGAVSPRGAIIIDVQYLDRIRSISRDDRVAWVESGAVLKELDAALGEHGLMLGHDPWSTPIATVGGAISTDGVGYRAARYGSMGTQVLALEVVLPTGRVMTTKSVPKNASGPRLDALFIGSEGAFGIITAAALRVFKAPEARRFATYLFPSFEAGFHAVNEMFSIGLRPAVTDLTEEPGDDGRREVTLYLMCEGYREEVTAQESRTSRICSGYGATDLGPQKTEEYWRERHRSGERYKHHVQPLLPQERWSRWWSGRADWDYLHLALPVPRVLEFKRKAEALCGEAGVSIRESAIWTEPELFSMILTRAAPEGDARDGFHGTVDRVLRMAQDMGGTMEYCHGVGLKLSHLIEREWGSGLEAVRQVKQALDPSGIMNPGKLGL